MGYGSALTKARLSSVDAAGQLKNIGLQRHPTQLAQTQKRELERLGRGLPDNPNEKGLASITTYAGMKAEQAKIAKQMVGQAKKAMAAQVAIHQANADHLGNAMEAGAKMAEIDSAHAQRTAIYGNAVTQSIAEATGVVAAYRNNAQMMQF